MSSSSNALIQTGEPIYVLVYFFSDRLCGVCLRSQPWFLVTLHCECVLRGILEKCSCTLLSTSMICRKVCSKIHADRNKLVLRSVLTCCVRADFSALAESYYFKKGLVRSVPRLTKCFTIANAARGGMIYERIDVISRRWLLMLERPN